MQTCRGAFENVAARPNVASPILGFGIPLVSLFILLQWFRIREVSGLNESEGSMSKWFGDRVQALKQPNVVLSIISIGCIIAVQVILFLFAYWLSYDAWYRLWDGFWRLLLGIIVFVMFACAPAGLRTWIPKIPIAISAVPTLIWVTIIAGLCAVAVAAIAGGRYVVTSGGSVIETDRLTGQTQYCDARDCRTLGQVK